MFTKCQKRCQMIFVFVISWLKIKIKMSTNILADLFYGSLRERVREKLLIRIVFAGSASISCVWIILFHGNSRILFFFFFSFISCSRDKLIIIKLNIFFLVNWKNCLIWWDDGIKTCRSIPPRSRSIFTRKMAFFISF